MLVDDLKSPKGLKKERQVKLKPSFRLHFRSLEIEASFSWRRNLLGGRHGGDGSGSSERSHLNETPQMNFSWESERRKNEKSEEDFFWRWIQGCFVSWESKCSDIFDQNDRKRRRSFFPLRLEGKGCFPDSRNCRKKIKTLDYLKWFPQSGHSLLFWAWLCPSWCPWPPRRSGSTPMAATRGSWSGLTRMSRRSSAPKFCQIYK